MEPFLLVSVFAAGLLASVVSEIFAETSSDFFRQGYEDFFWSIPVQETTTEAAVKLQATLPEVEYLRELCSQPIF